MNKAYLSLYIFIIFQVYAFYIQYKADKHISKVLPKKILKKYKTTTLLKSSLLNKKHWLSEISEDEQQRFIEANLYKRQTFSKILIAGSIFVVLLLLIISPEIYLMKHITMRSTTRVKSTRPTSLTVGRLTRR